MSTKSANKENTTAEGTTNDKQSGGGGDKMKPHCGIIMPISDRPNSGYRAGHWLQVRQLIVRAAQRAGFSAGMVSDNTGEDMIHASIIKNIYHNEVVVCDVSSLNPNVFLELGLRMSTLKPLVLVFDNEDSYPFDIRQFIHEPYPKDLHYFTIETFVDNLATKIKQVLEAHNSNKYKPFLSHFSEIHIEPAALGTESKGLLDVIGELATDVREIKRGLDKPSVNSQVHNENKLAGGTKYFKTSKHSTVGRFEVPKPSINNFSPLALSIIAGYVSEHPDVLEGGSSHIHTPAIHEKLLEMGAILPGMDLADDYNSIESMLNALRRAKN